MKVERILGGLVSFGLVAALAIPLASARSQANPATQAAGKEKGMHDKMQAALDSLNLTDDQKAKVKDILADAKTERQAVVSDTSLNDEQKRAKMSRWEKLGRGGTERELVKPFNGIQRVKVLSGKS